MKTDWRIKLGGSEFKLMRLQEATLTAPMLDTPERAATYLRMMLPGSLIYKPDVENVGMIGLSTRRRPIGMEIISQGTLDTLLVHPREIFKAAIVMNASAILLWHNHPSGDPSPSEADVKITRDLIRAGQILKIDVLDHLILGQPNMPQQADYVSLKELGYFQV